MAGKVKQPSVLKNSRFSHLFANDGAYCCQHSLTLHKAYGGKLLESIYKVFGEPIRVREAIEQLSASYPTEAIEPVVLDLTEKGLLVEDNKQDLCSYVELFDRGIRQYAIQHAYLIVTTGCNLRCKYCFVEDDERGFTPSFMNESTAEKGLDLFAKLTEQADRITLTFYGGEPLLNPKITKFAMRYVRALEELGRFKKSVDMTLLTNGVLVDADTVECVLETKTSVSVSIDGPKRFHDAVRPDAKNDATFDAALAGFRRLQDAGANPGVSCTLSASNVDHIEEIAEFIATELKPSGMGFNILLPRIDGSNPVDVSHEHAAHQLIKAFKILRKHGVYEDRVMRRVRPYTASRVHLKDCMGVGGQVVLTPEGRIGPCQAFLGLNEYFPLSVEQLHSRLEKVTSEDIYENELFDEWRHRFPMNMKECADCFAIGICGGGCPYASFANHGSVWCVDERVCSQSKQIMEWLIWDTYEHLLSESNSTDQLEDIPRRSTRQDAMEL